MIHPGSKALICKLLTRLRDDYPSLFVGDETEWRRRETRYWEKLKRFDVEVVEEACERAPDKHPDKFPTTGQLVMLCNGVLYERERREREEGARVDSAREERETREKVDLLRREVIPNDRAGQDGWVAEGETPFERLARSFEVESKRLNLDPNRECPQQVGQQRMAALMRTWNEASAYKPSPPQAWRTSRHQPPTSTAPRESEPGEDG